MTAICPRLLSTHPPNPVPPTPPVNMDQPQLPLTSPPPFSGLEWRDSLLNGSSRKVEPSDVMEAGVGVSLERSSLQLRRLAWLVVVWWWCAPSCLPGGESTMYSLTLQGAQWNAKWSTHFHSLFPLIKDVCFHVRASHLIWANTIISYALQNIFANLNL